MSNAFSEIMSQRTDEELARILSIHRDQYTAEALEAAQDEADKRALNVEELQLLMPEEVSEEEETKEVKAEKRLSKTNKYLSLFFPILFMLALGLLLYISNSKRHFFIPGPLIIQFIIYRQLKSNGYKRMASEFEKLSWFSYAILVGFAILLFLISSFLGSSSF